MRNRFKHSGITLTEMTIVIAAAAIVLAISVPAAKKLQSALESESGVRTIISSAIASARAIAAKNQRYAGIRFQKAGSFGLEGPSDTLDDEDKVLNADQYIVFIIHDYDKTGLKNGFRAVEGVEPIKLPSSLGVMDLKFVERTFKIGEPSKTKVNEISISSNEQINDIEELIETTSFSIIFSPSGKLVIHRVRVRNRDGISDTLSQQNDLSYDDIFNKIAQVDAEVAIFCQDDYFNSPDYALDILLGPEYSRNNFIIYNRDAFSSAFRKGTAYSDYLRELRSERVYIQPYTGRIMNRRNR